MAKNLTPEEKKAKYDEAMSKLKIKLDKRLEYLAAKRARLAAKIDEKYGADPEQHELQMGVMTIDNDVWIDIAKAEYEEHAKTLELKYLK